MINLNTGKIVRHYSTNTRINLVQKCVTPDKTYYRTSDAAHHYLNYAFEASAFGLPNEKAPSVPSSKENSSSKNLNSQQKIHTHTPTQKQTVNQKAKSPKDGEGKRLRSWIRKIFRRKNGNAKNT